MDITLLRYLLQINGRITSDIIKDLIQEHKPKRDKMIKRYDRYKVETKGVPILTREFNDPKKVNNKLNNDFFSEIVDTKIGYFAGKPIAYNLDKNAYKIGKTIDNTKYTKHLSIITDFNLRSSIDDLDSEIAKMAAICGYGARLLYIDRKGKEKVININPWEAIFISDGSTNEPQYALRYYCIYVREDKKTVERLKVEWYDGTHITFLVEDNSGDYVPDPTEPVNPKPHLFDEIPLICFPNNEEHQGDAEKVLNLIDGYDRTVSDVNSEIEQFRLAYMAFYGMEPDEDTMDAAQRTGAFGLETDSKVEFITKTLNDTAIENHLNRVEDNILRFAKSVNFSDEAFGGTITGIAMKFKMFGLESKCITAERKFTAALRQQYRILATAWAKKGIEIDYTNVFFTFKRNFPLNLQDEAETTAKFKGLISERTRLGLLSFVDDVDYELQLMQQENEDSVNLDDGDDPDAV